MELREETNVGLFIFRFLISIFGIIGNIILMISILKHSKNLKTYEILLVGLALSNLESIFIVDLYGLVIHSRSKWLSLSKVACNTMKCLTLFGEVTTILFTVVISIFRYQKLRDASKRVNLPILLDSVPVAVGVTVVCVTVAFAFGTPTYAMNLDDHMTNFNQTNAACPADFFQCGPDNCPVLNKVYKYSFLMICIMVPICVVTVSSSLILRTLLLQRKTTPAQSFSSTFSTRKASSFQRSTMAILAAMTIFQVDWIVYLVLHLALDPYSFPLWDQTEFLIATSYSTLSPYVYGAGNNLFSLRRLACRGT